jgi:methionyl-tRNA formyltransferase
MQLTAGMDEGPVYAQKKISLLGTETKFELYENLSASGIELLLDILPSIINGTLEPTPQNHEAATYCQLLSKADSPLNPTAYTAIEAERRIRAHLSFPKTKTNLLGHDIIITKAHVSTESKTPLDIQCRDGAYVSIDELIAPSGRSMSGEAFLRGYAA